MARVIVLHCFTAAWRFTVSLNIHVQLFLSLSSRLSLSMFFRCHFSCRLLPPLFAFSPFPFWCHRFMPPVVGPRIAAHRKAKRGKNPLKLRRGETLLPPLPTHTLTHQLPRQQINKRLLLMPGMGRADTAAIVLPSRRFSLSSICCCSSCI